MLSLTTGLASLLGLSAIVVMARVSSLGELGVFEDEYVRWWTFVSENFRGPAIRAWDALERAEHDRHVQVPRRTKSLE